MISIPQIAVLASGNGSNLQAILDETVVGRIPAALRVVISDKKDAYALERARKAGVEAIFISPKDFGGREEFDTKLAEELRARQIDWVILAGYMRILSPSFVRAFSNRILNIHPALLPKYPGTHSIERAFQNGEKKVGVTVHYVNEEVDAGPHILQESLDVLPGDTLDALTERVHGLEHRLYPEAIRQVLKR